MPLAASRDHIGPMARTVRDAAILMHALAWYDPDDPYSRDAPVEDYAAGLDNSIAGLRIASFHDDGKDPVPTDILDGFQSGLRTFEAAGAHIEPIEMSDLIARMDTDDIFTSDMYSHYADTFAEHADELSQEVRGALEEGRQISGARVMEAIRERDAVLHQVDRRLRGFDLAVSPTLGVHAAARRRDCYPLLRFTSLWDHNGWPAITVPVGLSEETGMPIGFQIIGLPWTEALLLRAARVIEKAHALAFPPSGLR